MAAWVSKDRLRHEAVPYPGSVCLRTGTGSPLAHGKSPAVAPAPVSASVEKGKGSGTWRTHERRTYG